MSHRIRKEGTVRENGSAVSKIGVSNADGKASIVNTEKRRVETALINANNANMKAILKQQQEVETKSKKVAKDTLKKEIASINKRETPRSAEISVKRKAVKKHQKTKYIAEPIELPW